MRKDIILDDSDDLYIENTVNPTFSVAAYEGEENGASLAAVRLNNLGANNLDTDRNGDLSIEAFIKLEEGFEGTNPLLLTFYYIDRYGRRFETPRLPLMGEKGEMLDKYTLRNIDPSGYHIRYQRNVGVRYNNYEGAFVASPFEQGDFLIDVSISQNEKILLIAGKGNILEHPLRGVDALQEINSNIDRDTMRDKVLKEFEKDELALLEFDIDTATGFLIIKSDELFNTGEE
jgi:hypothetical protein